MKIQTSELTGPALDWAVARAEGLLPTLHKNPYGYWVMPNIAGSYSTSWSIGGPIIEREEINLEIHEGGHTRASFYNMRLTFDGRAKHYHHEHGSTPLVAAMRCFVAAKFGDEVEVPDELVTP